MYMSESKGVIQNCRTGNRVTEWTLCAPRHGISIRQHASVTSANRRRRKAITNFYRRLTTLYAADPAQGIECVSTPEARSRHYGANFRLPGFAPSGFSPLGSQHRSRQGPAPQAHAARQQQCVALLARGRTSPAQATAAGRVHHRHTERPGRVRIRLLPAGALATLLRRLQSWRWRSDAFSTTSATATSGESVTNRECRACRKALTSAATM